jgi:uncharacterized SAM-binding protein YcdF (DUF218 family)
MTERQALISGNRLRRKYLFGLVFLILCLFIYVASGVILSCLGKFLVLDQKPIRADAIVVLNSGVEYYPRLIEAADLYRNGFSEKIIINGNRKTDILRDLEQKGFAACCPWYENSLRILSLYGVPRDKVLWISAEDAYDTVSEAEIVGNEVLRNGFKTIIITSSKYHMKRARFIWVNEFKDRLSICFVSAKSDPYDPENWWKEGRQIRWVLAEYGAWIYYFWKKIMPDTP